MKPKYFLFPLVAVIVTPTLVIFILEVFVKRMTPFKSVLDIVHRLKVADSAFLEPFSFIPCFFLILLIWRLSGILERKRLAFTFWGGFTGVIGLIAYEHFVVEYPLYAGTHMSSTSVLGYLLIPFLGVFTLVIGSGLGWLIGYLADDYNYSE